MRTAFEWMTALQTYRVVHVRRSITELAVTAAAFVSSWIAMVLAVRNQEVWLAVPLLPLTAGLLVRLFIIQHDCGHGSFFRRKRTNDWTGRVLSLLTLIPYDHWRRGHACHHAGSGNLAARGIGDVETMTVAEYHALSRLGRLRYRLYRHPAILFGLGPAFLICIKYRLPLGALGRSGSWATTLGTNVAVACLAAMSIRLFGAGPFLLVHVPVVLVAASIGVWLFYVQHQFDDTHWTQAEAWNVHEAALHGSSFYDLPAPLRWLTGNVGIHHVHHLSARIPFYRLPEALRDFPELAAVGHVSIVESLKGTRLALWNEAERRLVSFADARPAVARGATKI